MKFGSWFMASPTSSSPRRDRAIRDRFHRRLVVCDEIGYGWLHHLEERHWLDSHPQRDNDERRENGDLAGAEIEHGLEIVLSQCPKYYPAIHVEHIGRAENNTGGRQRCHPSVDLKGT